MEALLLRLLTFCATVACATAQTGPVLVWNTDSTVKLQQVIGEEGTTYYNQDTDRQTGSNLLNQTYGLYRVGGTDPSGSFEYNGRVNFLFGDTLYLNAGDTMTTRPGSIPTSSRTMWRLRFASNWKRCYDEPANQHESPHSPPAVGMAGCQRL